MPDPMRSMTDRRRYSHAVRKLHEKQTEELADRLLAGEITLAQWQKEMKKIIREANKLQFVTGKGGDADNIRPGDYGRIGTNVREQYKFLAEFADKIYEADKNGKSLGFVKNRAKLYAKSSQATFWQSAVPVKLPQVPRDGKTRCKSNCTCRLDIEIEQDDEGRDVAVKVYWKLRPADHCDDCKKLNREWSPLRLEITETLSSRRQGIKLAAHYDPAILKFYRRTA